MTHTSNAFGQDEREDLCQYIRDLTDDRLGWLISNPILSQDILEHAAFCGECGQRVEDIGREQAETLPSEIQAACEQMAAFPIVHNVVAGRLLSKTTSVSRSLPLAASNESPALRGEDVVLFGRCNIKGLEFAFLEEQEEGRVLLQGPIPTGATHLQLGSHLSYLKETALDDLHELEGISSLDVERFLNSTENVNAYFVTQPLPTCE